MYQRWVISIANISFRGHGLETFARCCTRNWDIGLETWISLLWTRRFTVTKLVWAQDLLGSFGLYNHLQCSCSIVSCLILRTKAQGY